MHEALEMRRIVVVPPGGVDVLPCRVAGAVGLGSEDTRWGRAAEEEWEWAGEAPWRGGKA